MKKIFSRRIPGLLVCAVLTMTLAMLTAGCAGQAASAASETLETVHDTVYTSQEPADTADANEAVQTVGDTVYGADYADVTAAAEEPQTIGDTVYGDESVEIPELGTGEICVAFRWEDNAGSFGQYYVHTDAKTVGEALEEAGLITGQDGKVLSVCGHESEAGSWRFCFDGQTADTGIYETPVLEGREYGLYAE